MNEIVATFLKKLGSRTKILLAGLLILLLLLVYGIGIVVLPISILFSHQNKNCDAVLTLHKMYVELYPSFLEDQTLSAPTRECDAYALATSIEERGSLQEAYAAYQAYLTAYPSGLYVEEAHERSVLVLISMVKDQIDQKVYDEALANLNLIISSHPDTSVSTDAWSLFPSTYTSWSTGLRKAKDFAGSEQVLNEFKNWSQTNQKNDLVMHAQRELAQTYLAWGLDLQSQKQFESALAKFELASAAPQSQFDFAAQVKAGQSSTYIDWGNELLEQDQFPVAIEKFELAISKSGGTNDENAADALANGQIHWAGRLSTDEDFQGALEHLQSAKEIAATDAVKKSVEVALQDTYLAFSMSSGPQARKAMKEVIKTVCQDQEAPDLPIFGLNKDSVRFAIYGVDDKLPEGLAAKTPGEMHYVACVTTDNRTIETRLHKDMVLQQGRFQYYRLVEQFRVQVIWDVRLLGTDTSKRAAEQIFKGEQPPPFAENAGNYFYGPTPMEEFKLWLQVFIQ